MGALGPSQSDACRAANGYEGDDNVDDHDHSDDHCNDQPCSAAVQALAGLIVEDGVRPQPAPQLRVAAPQPKLGSLRKVLHGF